MTSWQDRGWLGSLCRFARASARWQLLLVDAGERIPEGVRQGRGTHAAATHGGRALTLVGKRDAESGNVTFNVGPSDTHIFGGLFGAYFTYANTASLVYTDAQDAQAATLAELYSTHIRAFTTEKVRPTSG